MKSFMKTMPAIVSAIMMAGLTWSCSGVAEDDIPDSTPGAGLTSCPNSILISLGDEALTRTSHTYGEDYRMKTFWMKGDRVAVLPISGINNSGDAGIYRSDSDGVTGSFVIEKPMGRDSYLHGIYYPGEMIQTDSQFNNFSYDGQIQSKDDPMAHLGRFHTMMKWVSGDISEVDFSDAVQSACMRVVLSGMSFENPTRITVSAMRNSQPLEAFYNTNFLPSYYPSDISIIYPSESSSITIGLSGYSTESELTAYIMMSNGDVALSAGDVLRVEVFCGQNKYHSDLKLDSEIVLEGGHCHSLTVNDGWVHDPGDYTEYEYDGEVVTLQETGSQLDLVVMGDGFMNEDFMNRTYDDIMLKAIDAFFATQPIKSFKDDFNIYYVKAVSPAHFDATSTGNGAVNGTADTKFQVKFTSNSTNLSGNNDTVRKYAEKALLKDDSKRIWNATVIVVTNFKTRAGTCNNSWLRNNGCDYGQAFAIAYSALGRDDEEFKGIIRHEASGHGFGKLGDEYTSTLYYPDPAGPWDQLASYHDLGISRNIDKFVKESTYTKYNGAYPLTGPSNVYWKSLFGTANNYESSEGLGVFEGANGLHSDFCRPTENGNKSIMNSNNGIFNAPSRRQMFYRASVLSGDAQNNTFGTEAELQKFLEWDAAVFLPSMIGTKAETPVHIIEGSLPLAPPVNRFGHLEKGRFIEDN